MSNYSEPSKATKKMQRGAKHRNYALGSAIQHAFILYCTFLYIA